MDDPSKELQSHIMRLCKFLASPKGDKNYEDTIHKAHVAARNCDFNHMHELLNQLPEAEDLPDWWQR